MRQTPELKPRLVVLDRDDEIQARRDNPELLADKDTTVVPLPLRHPYSGLEELQRLGPALREGAVFVRNPFDQNHYTEVSDAYASIAKAKFYAFSRVCQLLGAVRLEVLELRELSETGERAASVKMSAGSVSGGLTKGAKQLKEVAEKLFGSWTWETGEPDQELAEQMAMKSGLHTDITVNSLLEQRRYRTNPLKSHELLLDISSEAQKEITFAADLNALLGGFIKPKFEAKMNSLKGQMHNLQLELSVDF
ncbi:hypothetical protein [Streptomyces marispadix]|uniref:Uncharacterized protein n=1 Tax=Streptomyces marispadix TaxID=2922868 RepID=A0ABS9ST69_9ACTN|nr:hypothetical protein [Streptomyces marispadix]MCH6159368.1 hypothetical protein [Streptomyces marispadix]